MHPPSYRWVCQNCQHTNDAGHGECVACDFPAEATGSELAAFRQGIRPKRRRTPALTAPVTPPNRLLPLAKLLWWAGGLFIPLTVFLTAQFGTRGYGGPGGWGSGFFILLLGIAAVSPTLIVCGILALLIGQRIDKRQPLLAGFSP